VGGANGGCEVRRSAALVSSATRASFTSGTLAHQAGRGQHGHLRLAREVLACQPIQFGVDAGEEKLTRVGVPPARVVE
jgi:hypothetical protein